MTTSPSANKKLVERYLAARSSTDRSKVAPLMTEDVEWIQWNDGVPPSGVSTKGKEAVLRALGENELQIEVLRMIEENDAVFAECLVRVLLKAGGTLNFHVCNLYDLEGGRVKRMSSFVIEPKSSA